MGNHLKVPFLLFAFLAAALLAAVAGAPVARGAGTGASSTAQIPAIEIISLAPDGSPANGDSTEPEIAGNGRFVVYTSAASNLVPGDGNDADDIFVHDLETGTTTRVSVATGGDESNGDSSAPTITMDGRHVAFVSYADNLDPADTGKDVDVFVHDRQTGVTQLVSIAPDGGDTYAYEPALGDGGNLVVFTAPASAGSATTAIFQRDVAAGTTEMVSLNMAGLVPNGSSWGASLAGDGGSLSFTSAASDLVAGDTNNAQDLFVRNLITGETTRASVSSDGMEANDTSSSGRMFDGGGGVGFISDATNLDPADDDSFPDPFVHLFSSSGPGFTAWLFPQEAETLTANGAVDPDAMGEFFAVDAYGAWPDAVEFFVNIFVIDFSRGRIELVSRAADGSEADGESRRPTLSDDGAWLAFETDANNLFPAQEWYQGTDVAIVLNPLSSPEDVWQAMLPILMR